MLGVLVWGSILLLVMDKSVVVVVGARREWCQLIVMVVFK